MNKPTQIKATLFVPKQFNNGADIPSEIHDLIKDKLTEFGGLTIINGIGYYKAAAGTVSLDSNLILIVICEDTIQNRNNFAHIAELVKRECKQESVLLTISTVEAYFI